MKVILSRLNDKLAFQALNESGATANFDANPAIGGENLGLRPMEMLAASMAACASIDVILILNKKRVELSYYNVEIIAEKNDTVPSPFHSIHLKFLIGENDSIEPVITAAQLGVEKYCSVGASLSKDIKITHSVEKINLK